MFASHTRAAEIVGQAYLQLRKEKKSVKSDILIDPSQVSVVGPVDLNQSVASAVSSPSNVSVDDSSVKKELSDLKDEWSTWSTRYARIEALLTMGFNPLSAQPVSAVDNIASVFSPVKVKVSHPPPAGVLSASTFLPHTVPPPPHPGQESVLEHEAPVDIQQPESSGYWPSLDQEETSAAQPGPWGFASPLENLYPDCSQDAEPTFGPPDREPISYDDLQDDQASASEAEPQEKDRLYTEDQSYRETVRGVRAYMDWSFIPDQEFTAQCRQDNLWTGTRSQPVGKIYVTFPPEDWSLEQMNLYIIYGHVSHSGERGSLRTDQFLKVPKTQNRWYNLHPAPNPGDTRPGKVVKFWSNDAPHLNSSFSRIAKPSGLTMTSAPLLPVAQDTLRNWDKALREGTYVCNQAAGFNCCITKQENLLSLESEFAKGKSEG